MFCTKRTWGSCIHPCARDIRKKPLQQSRKKNQQDHCVIEQQAVATIEDRQEWWRRQSFTTAPPRTFIPCLSSSSSSSSSNSTVPTTQKMPAATVLENTSIHTTTQQRLHIVEMARPAGGPGNYALYLHPHKPCLSAHGNKVAVYNKAQLMVMTELVVIALCTKWVK